MFYQLLTLSLGVVTLTSVIKAILYLSHSLIKSSLSSKLNSGTIKAQIPKDFAFSQIFPSHKKN